MPYSKKIVLHCTGNTTLNLEQLVEDFIAGGVTFIAVVGKNCRWVEDLIDGYVVGDGTKDRFILTSSHPGQSVADAVAFARSLSLEYAGDDVQVVGL
jgi:hypothetical protein